MTNYAAMGYALLAADQMLSLIHIFEQIFMMYRPLLLKQAIGDQGLDEDLYQELSRTLYACIQKFTI